MRPAPVHLAPQPRARERDAQPASSQLVLTDDSVKIAVLLTSQMLNLPREAVIVTVVVGLQAVAHLTEVNPLLLARLYAASQHPLPESIERFYTRLAESPFLRQALLDDHRATYGGMLDSANRAAGLRAGITDGQAREVVAVLLPAINHALCAANTDGEAGYTRLVQSFGTPA